MNGGQKPLFVLGYLHYIQLILCEQDVELFNAKLVCHGQCTAPTLRERLNETQRAKSYSIPEILTTF